MQLIAITRHNNLKMTDSKLRSRLNITSRCCLPTLAPYGVAPALGKWATQRVQTRTSASKGLIEETGLNFWLVLELNKVWLRTWGKPLVRLALLKARSCATFLTQANAYAASLSKLHQCVFANRCPWRGKLRTRRATDEWWWIPSVRS
jgi:hypothetical protein